MTQLALDHRPFLADTDLRTAEDVARWLHEIDDDDITGGDPMWLTISRLDARLDRERRQACRRGARRTFADAAELMRGYALEQKCGVVRDTGIEYAIGHYLTRALAFRAAARQP